GNKVKLLPEDESFSSAVNAIISEAQAVARLTSQIPSSPPRKNFHGHPPKSHLNPALSKGRI
ncbi:hypothetical protein Tco_1174951, partial [Tanacetum coccineum]